MSADRVLGWGCITGLLIVCIVVLALTTAILAEAGVSIPVKAFISIGIVLLMVILASGGIQSAFDFDEGSDSASAGCLLPILSVGLGLTSLKLLGVSWLLLALIAIVMFIILVFAYQTATYRPWWW